MQLVTLSTRPEVLAETWAHVRQFMGWVDELVVVTPKALAPRFAIDGATVLSDEDVTALSTGQLSALDHTERNFTIRGGLGTRAEIDDVFLMSDDDYRPLKPVHPDLFLDGDRHRGFYFYDLDAWPGDSTTFDAGQHHTRELLGYLGYERLAYASHMPQIIRKAHLAEAWELADRLSPTRCLCEWAWYFNVARALHPGDYAEPQPFRTLCWPQYPNEWPWWIRPAEYVFENFYPELYLPGHLFAGLPTAVDPDGAQRHNVEKILRWSELGRRTARLDFPADVANPWTQQSVLRRLAFGLLRPLRKAYDYVSMPDRTRLTELSGTVARLEDDLRRTRDT
jgi:hypothetical protein